jgi:hypothetical protein
MGWLDGAPFGFPQSDRPADLSLAGVRSTSYGVPVRRARRAPTLASGWGDSEIVVEGNGLVVRCRAIRSGCGSAREAGR